MPITKIDTSASPRYLEKVCAQCNHLEQLPLDALLLGVSSHRCDPNIIRLSPCSSCGACEFLVRTWDSEPEGGGGPTWAHRKAVNALAILLKKEGKIHPDAAATLAAETKSPSAASILPVVVQSTQQE